MLVWTDTRTCENDSQNCEHDLADCSGCGAGPTHCVCRPRVVCTIHEETTDA